MMDIYVQRVGPYAHYEIVWDVQPDGSARVMQWRVARQVLTLEEFNGLATATFTDWCRRNGYPEEVTG